MCGRYALALRPSQVRHMLQEDDVPVDEAPDDDGDDAPRQSYNFAPGYHGIVYRADVPDWGAGPRREHGGKARGAERKETSKDGEDEGKAGEEVETEGASAGNKAHVVPEERPPTHYKLQSMKWGLVPFWTKRNPDYGSMLKTINCRDDSLATPGGMWATMKARKRCVVVAQGFYEWLKSSGSSRDKTPHFVRRKDGALMCFAGLWDCVQFESDGGGDGEGTRKQYTYTIVTTSSNTQLRFLHDRMPVILDQKADGGAALRTWLDPGRHEWSRELQALLRPFEGELEVYPVSKEVGKVGNDSPSFIVPVASKENKGNIANFFANAKGGGKTNAKGGAKKKKTEDSKAETEGTHQKEEDEPEVEVKTDKEDGAEETKIEMSIDEASKAGISDIGDDGGAGTERRGVKREASSPPAEEAPRAKKSSATAANSVESLSPRKEVRRGRAKISATSNVSNAKSPTKGKDKGNGSQKITKFFGNSA